MVSNVDCGSQRLAHTSMGALRKVSQGFFDSFYEQIVCQARFDVVTVVERNILHYCSAIGSSRSRSNTWRVELLNS